MTRLETRPEALQHRLAPLLRAYERREPLTLEEFEALTEASFRLGVHERTDVDAAFEHLHRGHKLDGSNPRYAYHLGRLYLAHGEFELAGQWLKLALRHAPTNHRVWAHLAIAQRGLDERARGDPAVEPNALRERADRVLTAIQDGQDRLDAELTSIVAPPSRASLEQRAERERGGPRAPVDPVDPDEEEAPAQTVMPRVPRLTRAGVCRWSGVHDLAIEAAFRAAASARTRDKLLPALREVADLAGSRPGGPGAVGVLGVLWVVAGYPIGPIRAACELVSDEPLPSLELLELVCDVMELDEEQLPGRLAACRRAGTMPASLVAMIHHQRMLWRPMAIDDRGAVRVARAFARDAREREDDELTTAACEQHVSRLESLLRGLQPGEPPARVAEPEPDTAADDLDTSGAGARLAAQELVADKLEELAGELLEIVKTALPETVAAVDDDASYSLARAEHDALTSICAGIRQAAVDAGADLDEVKARIGSLSSGELGDDFNTRLDTCRKRVSTLSGLGNIGRSLKRADKGLREAGDFTSTPCDPSDRVRELRRALIGDDDEPESPPPTATVPPPAPVEEPTSPVARVRGMLERVDRAVDERFERAHATFAAYDREDANAPPLRELRAFVLAHQADALYRLDRREEAQRVWYRMLAADRLDLRVLKNLAVSHTQGGEIAQATAAWQAYVEALYFMDVAAGSPRRYARERAHLHGVFAGAYSTPSLSAGLKKRDLDLGDTVTFLASAGRARTFSAHWRLSALNEALAMRSPTLVLGLSRSTDEASLQAGRERQLALAREACAWLPERIRVPFRELALRCIEEAFEQASQVKRRKRDRRYQAEEDLHVAALKNVVLMKLRVRDALVEDMDWATSSTSGDVLANLRYIDEIELDPQDALVARTLQAFGVTEVERFLEEFGQLGELCANLALRRIFGLAGAPPCPAKQFPQVAASWVRNGMSSTVLDTLDDPQMLYGPAVEEAFAARNREGELNGRDRRLLEQAVAELGSVAAAFPGATGPARLSASLLLRLGRSTAARELLEAAQRSAFHPDAAERALPPLIIAYCDEGSFEQARAAMRSQLACRTSCEEDLVLLESTYGGWLSKRGASPPAHDEIRRDFDGWLAGAEAAGLPDDVRSRGLAAKRELVAAAIMASCRNGKGELDDDKLASAVERERSADPENRTIHYLQAQCAFKACVELSKGQRPTGAELAKLRTRLEQRLSRAQALALEVLAASTQDDPWVPEVRTMLEQIKAARTG